MNKLEEIKSNQKVSDQMSLMLKRKESVEREIEACVKFIDEKRDLVRRVQTLEEKLGFN